MLSWNIIAKKTSLHPHIFTRGIQTDYNEDMSLVDSYFHVSLMSTLFMLILVLLLTLLEYVGSKDNRLNCLDKYSYCSAVRDLVRSSQF
jgi:hypothetical protein